MYILNKYYKQLFFTSLFFLLPFFSFAADFKIVPEGNEFGIGQEFVVDLIIDTKDDQINAAQGTINFPTNVLELLEASRNPSAFNFWVEGPTISNEDGTLVFIGGTSNSNSGEALQVLKLKFRATGSGVVNLTMTEAVITASDGKGTNILENIEEPSLSIGTNVVLVPQPQPIEEEFNPTEVVVEKPKPITRTAVQSTNLPDAPKINVPIYPNPEKWFKHIEDITVLWEVPDDVIKVAIEVDQNPNTEPLKAEEELFNGKDIGRLEEGIWYVHVQFRNNIGWGEVTHYRISIDQTKPLPFEIELDSFVSDNPSPLVIFNTQDALSGIDIVQVLVGGKEVLRATSTTGVILPAQKPGIHELSVKVFDKARNLSENVTTFEVLPLPTPIINFITDSVASGELLFVSGKTLPNSFIDISINNKSGSEVFSKTFNSDSSGNWEAIIEDSFLTAKYNLLAIARDDRGAISFPSESREFKVKPKVVISLGFVEFGWFEILIIIVLLAVSGVSAYSWYYLEEQKKKKAYQTIAIRDVKKMTTLMDKDVNEVKGYIKKQKDVMNSQIYGEISHLLDVLSDTSAKMKKYLGKELDDIT